jgi:hypothetical protein
LIVELDMIYVLKTHCPYSDSRRIRKACEGLADAGILSNPRRIFNDKAPGEGL